MAQAEIKAREFYNDHYADETDPYRLRLLIAMTLTHIASIREDKHESGIEEWKPIGEYMNSLAKLDPDQAMETATELVCLPPSSTYSGWLHTNAIDMLKSPAIFSKFAAKMEETSLQNSLLASRLNEFLLFDPGQLDPKSATNRSELYKLAGTADLVGKFVNPPAFTAAQALFGQAYDRMADQKVRDSIGLYQGTAVNYLFDSLSQRFWTKSK